MLQVGTVIQAKLIEEVEKDHWIVSFQGQLLQVRNTTPVKFKPSLLLQLKVESPNPLCLKVIGPARRGQERLNLFV